MRAKAIDKRPRQHSRGETKGATFIAKLVEKVNNLPYVVGLFYKMLKAKELRGRIDEVEVPTHPKKVREELREEDREDTPQSPMHGASSGGAIRSGDEDKERIDSVLRDLNISLDHILEEQITRDGVTTVHNEDVEIEVRAPTTETIEPIDMDPPTPTKPSHVDEIEEGGDDFEISPIGCFDSLDF